MRWNSGIGTEKSRGRHRKGSLRRRQKPQVKTKNHRTPAAPRRPAAWKLGKVCAPGGIADKDTNQHNSGWGYWLTSSANTRTTDNLWIVSRWKSTLLPKHSEPTCRHHLLPGKLQKRTKKYSTPYTFWRLRENPQEEVQTAMSGYSLRNRQASYSAMPSSPEEEENTARFTYICELCGKNYRSEKGK